MGHEQRFFTFRQITEDRFSDISFRLKDADNIILYLERLADEDAEARDVFNFLIFGAGKDGSGDHGAVKSVARGFKCVIKENLFFIDVFDGLRPR